jgi:hypothetical protein
MGSNVTFQSRNVLSKKFMGDAGKVRRLSACAKNGDNLAGNVFQRLRLSLSWKQVRYTGV